jgi:hypothetical protein
MAMLLPVYMYKFYLTSMPNERAVMMRKKKKKSVLRSLLIAFEHERKTESFILCSVYARHVHKATAACHLIILTSSELCIAEEKYVGLSGRWVESSKIIFSF